MDRNEALELLKTGPLGIIEWNQRRQKGEPIPSLKGADLRGANLSGTVLTAANLGSADLRSAKLIDANLSLADLTLADLSSAHLVKANLYGARLSGAQFSKAVCVSTVFADVDLSEVMGLESILHMGRSTIGIDTLFRSNGKIPEAFLRGCGVPASVIVELLTMVARL